MIDSKSSPPRSIVRLIEPKDDAPMQAGRLYEIDYWDGCCVHIRGEDGIGYTLNRVRFEPQHVTA